MISHEKMIIVFFCLLGTVLTGCSGNEEPFAQKSYEADGGEVSAVAIDVRDREISVTLSSDNRIHIDYFENSKERYDISVTDEQVLVVKTANEKEWTDYIGGKASEEVRKISLQVPDALLKKLQLSTTNEDISLPAMTVTEEISLSANGGDIRFEPLNAGKAIRLEAKNGNISGEIVGGYDDYAITCTIKKGESNLPSKKEGGDKTLEVSNNNGDIDLSFVKE